jgi:hypothetical protein
MGPARFGNQLDMSIFQGGEHLGDNIEELIIAGLPSDLRPESLILPHPVDIAQDEEWIPAVKGFPELLKIRFGVVNDHEVTLLG